MNTRILVRTTPENYERLVLMAGALAEFYGDRLSLADCLEFTTEDAGIAAAVATVYGVAPNPEPLDLHAIFDAEWEQTLEEACRALHPDETTPEEHAAQIARLTGAVAAEDLHDRLGDNTTEDLLAPVLDGNTYDCEPAPELPAELATDQPAESPTLAAVQAVARDAGAKVREPKPCDECGAMFTPKRSDSRFCSTACSKTWWSRQREGKTNGNGHKAEETKAEADDESHPAQTRKWLIEKAGGEHIEVDSIHHLLDRNKLEVGTRCHKKGGSWFRVENVAGVLALVGENIHAAQ